jgi:hypothetical protein
MFDTLKNPTGKLASVMVVKQIPNSSSLPNPAGEYNPFFST